MPHPALQMGKENNSVTKLLRKIIRNIHVSSPEGRPLLSHKDRSKGNQSLTKFRERLSFQVPIVNYAKPKSKVDQACEHRGHHRSKDEQFKSLMSKKQYFDACLLIHDVEQMEKLDGRELYEVVAQEMWISLTLAIDGDPNQTVRLQSISQCIQWTKEQQGNKGLDWSPHKWVNEMETLFENDIKKYIPKYDPKRVLDHCLEELEKNISEIITKLEQFPEVLTATYLKCLHEELLSQLMSLADKKLKYEDHVLLFKWTHKEHRRLCRCRVGSEDFDHMLFGNWFLDCGNKIASAGRDAMYKAFVETLQSEILWISDPKDDVRYYFTDVLEEGTRICKAVEDLGDTLVSRLKSLFWEEFLHFVTRYKTFLTEKPCGLHSEDRIYIGIRIFKNCCILRNTMSNFGAAPQDQDIQGIQSLIGECENKGTDLILSNFIPSLKEAFKNYFKKNCDQYESVLRSLKRVLVKQDIQHDQMLATLIHHRLVVLFIQSFFKWSKKSSDQNIGERFSNGSKKLLDFFTDMVSDDSLLHNNPLNFICEMLTANDYQSLQATTVFFIHERQDLREEHLNALLNIKGNLSGKDKENLLYYIRNRVMDPDQSKLCFFEDIKVDNSKYKYFMCCCIS